MRYLIFIFILYSSFKISAQKNLEVFQLFHDYYAAGKYDSLADILSDDLIVTQNNKTIDDKTGYMQYIREWNAAFGTVWQVHSVQKEKKKIVSIESDSDVFHLLLYEKPPLVEFVYTIEKGKIQHIEYHYTEEAKADNAKFEVFYSWVSQNYPDAVLYFDKPSYETAVLTRKLMEEFLAEND